MLRSSSCSCKHQGPRAMRGNVSNSQETACKAFSTCNVFLIVQTPCQAQRKKSKHHHLRNTLWRHCAPWKCVPRPLGTSPPPRKRQQESTSRFGQVFNNCRIESNNCITCHAIQIHLWESQTWNCQQWWFHVASGLGQGNPLRKVWFSETM